MKTIDEILGDTLEIAVGEGALSCAELEDRLAQTVHGQAAIADEAVRAHLAVCASCQELAETVMTGELGDALVDAGHGPRPDHPELPVVPRDVYERGREVGRGGMGKVTRARDLRLGRMVVLKELHEARLRERFEREARLTARLQHPGIVNVLEAGRWPDGEPFYAMKYVAGRSLSELITDEPTLSGRMKYLPNLIAAVEAVAYAHAQRVIHRDLKPHNILVGPFGETVVVDWGLAKGLEDLGDEATSGPYRGEDVALTRAGAGTPRYMPPEQAAGGAVDERADVYALGATLHHLLAGKAPGNAALPGETPAELAAIVAKAMASSVEQRYRDAGELAKDLSQFQTGQLVSAHQYSLGQLLRRFVRRHRVAVRATLMVVSSLIGIGGISVMRVVDARGVAESRRVDAESRAAALLVEQARQDVLAGRMDRARERLAAAKRLGESGPVAAFLAAEIGRKELVPLGGRIAAPTGSPFAWPTAYRVDTGGFAERTLSLRQGAAVVAKLLCNVRRYCGAAPPAMPRHREPGYPGSPPSRHARASAAFDRFVVVADWEDLTYPQQSRRLTAWNADGTLRWERTLDDVVAAVDLSADGGTAVARVRDRLVILDADRGEVRQTIGVPPGAIALSADGRLVAMAGEGVVRLFELGTARTRELRVTGPSFSHLEISPDGRRLIAGRGDAAYVFDVDGGLEAELRHEGVVMDVGWVPASDRAFTASPEETRIWARGGALVLAHPDSAGAAWVGFSADGRVLTHYSQLSAHRWLLPVEASSIPGVVVAAAREDGELGVLDEAGVFTTRRGGRVTGRVASPVDEVVTPGWTTRLIAGSGGRWILFNGKAGARSLDPATGASTPIPGLAESIASVTTARGVFVERFGSPDWVLLDADGEITPVPEPEDQFVEAIAHDGAAAWVRRRAGRVWIDVTDGKVVPQPSIPADWELATVGRGMMAGTRGPQPTTARSRAGLRASATDDGRVVLSIADSVVGELTGFAPPVRVAFTPSGDELMILDERGLTMREVSSR